ncbi:dienelactone hydrolase family protein [Legionella spiritensis]|uniref:dienelactone hydrolase family protein n=1 Tax=Legionella spiritensis TaxID=452 RepID=UPI000F6E01AD|nr:dienelactone hydrolase family protein [Legionella spiritensis]VEG92052.1 dienelactone hydrolase family protein [Legionella spiritensis]
MIVTKEIEYQDDGVSCRGYLAYDERNQQPMPGVMVAPDWGGRGEAACAKARQLAEMGYAGFAIDMYGNAQLGHDKVQRRALMTPFIQDRARLAARMKAAFEALTSQSSLIDAKKTAAIGYCFGGLCVLDLARTGADIRGAVSFHGLLSEPQGVPQAAIRAKLLVLHGYDDPLVPPEQVTQFADEMTMKKADWQVHIYGLTAHSFTDPKANDDEMGLHYNKTADSRSWTTTSQFLKEILVL